MITYVLLLVLGFVLLIKGADWLIDGASALARRFHVSELAIGLTVVAFGTSAPELVVNSIASANGFSEVVLGNVIGSNVFNTLAILGICGMIYPLTVQSSTVMREIPFSIFVGLLVFAMFNNFFTGDAVTSLNWVNAGVLLIFFAAFVYYAIFVLKKDLPTEEEGENEAVPLWKSISITLLGLVSMVFGGQFVVENAIAVASAYGVSEKLISLTIVAAGTSMPELAASSVAAFKKRSDIAIGNIIGSNIFNMLLVFGVSGLVNPIVYNEVFNFDIMVFVFSTLLLFLFMFVHKRFQLDRWQAALMFLFFLAYNWYIISRK